MSAVLQRKLDGKGSGAFEALAVEGSCGKEGASWQAMENDGKRPVCTRNVGILFVWKIESTNVYEGCRERKAGRDTRPMAM